MKVLVFGIFDGLHPGHTNFLRQAQKYGDFLVVAVGRASCSRQIKCKTPKLSLRQRLTALRGEPLVDKAVPGDITQGSYKVVLREKPDIICLGYDQKALGADIARALKAKELKIGLKILKPYKPDKYHTRLMRASY